MSLEQALSLAMNIRLLVVFSCGSHGLDGSLDLYSGTSKPKRNFGNLKPFFPIAFYIHRDMPKPKRLPAT